MLTIIAHIVKIYANTPPPQTPHIALKHFLFDNEKLKKFKRAEKKLKIKRTPTPICFE
ncbi:hypothetical protein SAE01_31950 [Segetibacter aerophilus]|uniref:Uncharacterized protein n=1 Tax=Segetibacter aerophilus TaxID=670293 RepID=A0A512BFF2_9BACT|nr:hypothetical protein SAE01_31950 [Segetibacter aerophilus]